MVVQYSSIVKFVTGLCAQKNLEIWATFQIIHTPKFQLLFLIMFFMGGKCSFFKRLHTSIEKINHYIWNYSIYSGMRKWPPPFLLKKNVKLYWPVLYCETKFYFSIFLKMDFHFSFVVEHVSPIYLSIFFCFKLCVYYKIPFHSQKEFHQIKSP